MSGATADYSARLSLADTVAWIERQQAETRKFIAEHDKLAAESTKPERERLWFPVGVDIAFMAAGGALVAGTLALLKVMGG